MLFRSGLQDNEAAIYEGNPGFRRIGNLGDGFHTTMNSTGNIQIVESYYFNRKRSIDGGGSWPVNGTGGVSEVACFNVPMVFSKAAGSTYAFAGTVYFKRSTNSGSSWSNLNGGSPIAGANNPCIAMAAPTNSIVYFSTAPGSGVRSKLWKTTNATAANPTFTEITGTLPDRYYSDIAVDPTNPNRLVVTLSGFGSSHVYMSMNGGSTWSNLGTGLPDIPHNTVMINPLDIRQIYVGNDIGVFYANYVPYTGSVTATTNVTWTAYNEGITDAIMVSDLAITNGGLVRMATYGRGLWEREEAFHTVLPVQFKAFDVRVTEHGNLCTWDIAEQVGVARYEVEYSKDKSDFVKVGSVNAIAGSGDIRYEYLHRIYNDVEGYYRIKSVDVDGAYRYSPVRVVTAQNRIYTVTAYPNPSNGKFQLRVPLQRQGSVQVQIFLYGDRKSVV